MTSFQLIDEHFSHKLSSRISTVEISSETLTFEELLIPLVTRLSRERPSTFVSPKRAGKKKMKKYIRLCFTKLSSASGLFGESHFL